MMGENSIKIFVIPKQKVVMGGLANNKDVLNGIRKIIENIGTSI